MKRTIIKTGLMVTLVLILWFPVTWFFFGSVHPCGILNYRMAERNRMYALYIFLGETRRDLELIERGLAVNPPKDTKDTIADTIAEWEQSAYNLSPAACSWRAITWRWNPEKDEALQQLKRMADGSGKAGRFTPVED